MAADCSQQASTRPWNSVNRLWKERGCEDGSRKGGRGVCVVRGSVCAHLYSPHAPFPPVDARSPVPTQLHAHAAASAAATPAAWGLGGTLWESVEPLPAHIPLLPHTHTSHLVLPHTPRPLAAAVGLWRGVSEAICGLGGSGGGGGLGAWSQVVLDASLPVHVHVAAPMAALVVVAAAAAHLGMGVWIGLCVCTSGACARMLTIYRKFHDGQSHTADGAAPCVAQQNSRRAKVHTHGSSQLCHPASRPPAKRWERASAATVWFPGPRTLPRCPAHCHLRHRWASEGGRHSTWPHRLAGFGELCECLCLRVA